MESTGSYFEPCVCVAVRLIICISTIKNTLLRLFSVSWMAAQKKLQVKECCHSMSGLHNIADHRTIGPRGFLRYNDRKYMNGKTVKG